MYASFTNWEPKAMTPFLKYIETIDEDKPDILKNLIDQCLVRKKVKTVEQLNEKEREYYKTDRINYLQSLTKIWQ